jgi:alkyl sulfatase BDS1-like metallo-beta-lactamase superfamily hydrolase
VSVLVSHPDAAHRDITLNVVMPDIWEEAVLTVSNVVLNYKLGDQSEEADATVTMDWNVFVATKMGRTTLAAAIENRLVTVEDDREKAQKFMGLLEPLEFWFNIVTH